MKSSKIILLLIIFFFLIFSTISLFLSRYSLSVASFSSVAENNGKINIRIVSLTDLHGATFGKNNKRLIKKIEEQSPDIITMTGDMLDSRKGLEEVDELCYLIKEFSKTATVFYSLGNHELYLSNEDLEKLKQLIVDSGAILLDSTYKDIEIKGKKIRIGGAYGYLLPEQYGIEKEQLFIRELADTDLPVLLLSHMSEGFLLWGDDVDRGIDLVLCGHDHGGQIRLPFIGGLVSPEEGFFPQYTKGMFHKCGADVVLSAGLGSELFIPRFNNPPEIIVVDWKI